MHILEFKTIELDSFYSNERREQQNASVTRVEGPLVEAVSLRAQLKVTSDDVHVLLGRHGDWVRVDNTRVVIERLDKKNEKESQKNFISNTLEKIYNSVVNVAVFEAFCCFALTFFFLET